MSNLVAKNYEMLKSRQDLRDQDPFLFYEIVDKNDYQISPDEVNGSNVIDLGANKGFFSILSHYLGAKNIVAVESYLPTYIKLEQNCREFFNIHPKYRAALNCSFNNVKAILDRDEDVCAYVDWSKEGDIKVVDLKEILSLFLDESDNIILKLDIESSEYDFLYGANVSDIRKCKIICMETHEGEKHNHNKKSPLQTGDNLFHYLLFLGYSLSYKASYMIGPDVDPSIKLFKFIRI